MIKVTLSPEGGANLDSYRRDVAKQLVDASARATHKAAIVTLDDIRTAMRRARLGKLANTIQSSSDLRKKRVPSGDGGFDVGGFVYARDKAKRTRGLLEAYVTNAATTIVPKGGKWLAIPSNQIPKRVGRRRMTPDLYRSSGLEERIGLLSFVKGRNAGVAYLIVHRTSINPDRTSRARSLTTRGRVRKGYVEVSVLAFTLIRATRRSHRVDPHAIASPASPMR